MPVLARVSLFVCLSIVGLALIGEALARFGLGLGTPPLSVKHPTIDYMFAPNQDVRRFGNRQFYNAQGMRSEPLETVGDRRFVLVFGDSVLNGGSLTDHDDLATTRAADEATFFGNVSAGSWGPGNYRAWIDEFGLFDADTVIFVLSNHDVGDQPTFAPLNPNTHPTSQPVLALTELIRRYTPRYMPRQLAFLIQYKEPNTSRPVPNESPTGLEDMATMFERLARTGIPGCILLHPTQTELAGSSRQGTAAFEAMAAAWSFPTIDLAPRYRQMPNTSDLYRPNDNIHINAAGQAVLADAIRSCIEVARVPRRTAP